jgi:2-polyprenyl-3-methyl-5-hydroxy-6-metoxy-1,4-benzoquinol methylase
MVMPPEGERRDNDDVPHCCFDDWASSNADRVRKGQGSPIVGAMLDQLEAAGLADRTLLDIGCGAGELALGAIDRGASRVRGVDLGPGAIDTARALADERGLWDRTTFEVLDGSRSDLGTADVVALSRVVCCYPDPRGLVDNASRAAQGVLAYSAPIDRGVTGITNRVVVALSNGWYRIRPAKYRGFRTFVHDLDAIDARVREAGFTERHRSRLRLVWELVVYER